MRYELSKEDILNFQEMANMLRMLCADMIQEANSGHPGAPMGLADIATLLGLYIRVNPKNPSWLNRDRIVFSGGHASSLIYALLYLWGFDVSLDDLKQFRQLDSKTPGHPEYLHTPGVEISTGPLGQGIANAVGFALASKGAQEILGRQVINHYVFCFCGDGDLQEGISYEACSFAGKNALNNLILIYDSNNISIEGAVDNVFDEDVKQRFSAQNFAVFECVGHDFFSINKALNDALEANKPSIIIARTIIGKGALGLEDSNKVHGSPLGADVILQAKLKFGFDGSAFNILDSALLRFRNVGEVGELANREWENNLSQDSKNNIARFLESAEIIFPKYEQGTKIATRVSNGEILNAIAKASPSFIGGSADLAPSNNTELKNMGDFPNGKNLHFGIREHAMGAIGNGIATYGLFTPFLATFFVFSDYLMPSIRVAALMKIKIYYVFTHDSIGVGEDGPTHQPIEQLSHLRSMPNILTFRPADGSENVACWQVALSESKPCAFILSRQNLEVLSANLEDLRTKVARGAYILSDASNPKITLVASGSEVALALRVKVILEFKNFSTRVVSAPCFELLDAQDAVYKQELFGSSRVVIIEAARALEWYKYAWLVIGMESFGASGKGEELFKKFGFEAQTIADKILNLI